MTASQHTIAGTVITMPVKVRRATQYMAMFSVDADAAQRMIDYSGLRVCRYLPGRAIAVLVLMHYLDSDLGQYHEYGTNIMVNPPGSTASGPRALQSAGAFIHHLPVDQAFTLEAGRTIWGVPKVMADFTIRESERFGFDVSFDGQLAVSMELERGFRAPSVFTSRTQMNRTYAQIDGVTRESMAEMSLSGARYRLGGARLWLGDHPYAKELASLGLPKRALLSSSAANVEMSVDDAKEIS
jgi:Acetoacetate decarboxylase (ADC)